MLFQELRDILGEAAKKGGGYPPGTVRSWKGRGDFKKTKQGDWVPVKGGLKRKAGAAGAGAAPKKKAKEPEQKLKRKAPAGGGGPKGKKKPAGGGGGPPPGGGGGGPEKTSPGRGQPKPPASAAGGAKAKAPKAKGPGSAGTRFKSKSAYNKPGASGASPEPEPGDFDDPDHDKQMRSMFKSLSKSAQDKILAKVSPSDRDKLTAPEPEPIKLTNPVGAGGKTSAGRGQASKPGPPVATAAGRGQSGKQGPKLEPTHISPPERGGPAAAAAPKPQVKPAENPQGETAASELKKALGHAYKAFKIPFKRMSDHLRKPETQEKIKATAKAALRTAANAAKMAGRGAAAVGRAGKFVVSTYAKHMTPGLFKAASKLARGDKISVEDHDKMKKDLTRVISDLVANVGAYAATGGHPGLYAERGHLKKMTKMAVENKIGELVDYALKKKAGGKKQQSAVEELRYILNAKEDDFDPSDLEGIMDEVISLLGSDFDMSDADIGSAFKSSGATPEMAKAWANASSNEGQNERHAGR
jgi:hypothetical protein